MRSPHDRRRNQRRHRMLAAWAACGLICAAALPTASAADRHHPHHPDTDFDVLVFSKTAGFRHDSIPAGIAAIRELGAANGFTVTATEDAAAFTTGQPRPVQGGRLPVAPPATCSTPRQQAAFESYIRARRRLRRRPRRRRHRVRLALVRQPGRRLVRLPPGDPAGRRHASRTARTPPPRTCRRPGRAPTSGTTTGPTPAPNAQVLATLDESRYSGGTMGGDHPITWCNAVDGGRSFYTGARAHRRRPTPTRTSARTCSAASGTRPARPRPTAAPRPATRRCYNGSTTGLVAGRARARSPTPTAR